MQKALKNPAIGMVFNERVVHGDRQYRNPGACRRG